MPAPKPSPRFDRRPRFIALGVFMAASLAASCRATPTPAAPAATASDNTWAVVDGREISRADVEKAYQRTGNASQTLSEEETLAAKLSLLDDLILQDILIAKARAAKVEVADSELDKSFAEAKKNIPDEAFQQELTKRGVTAADMREGLQARAAHAEIARSGSRIENHHHSQGRE